MNYLKLVSLIIIAIFNIDVSFGMSQAPATPWIESFYRCWTFECTTTGEVFWAIVFTILLLSSFIFKKIIIRWPKIITIVTFLLSVLLIYFLWMIDINNIFYTEWDKTIRFFVFFSIILFILFSVSKLFLNIKIDFLFSFLVTTIWFLSLAYYSYIISNQINFYFDYFISRFV